MALATEIRKLAGGDDPLVPFQADTSLMAIKTPEALAEAMNGRHLEAVRDTKRHATALWLGAAWRHGEAAKLMIGASCLPFLFCFPSGCVDMTERGNNIQIL